MNTLSCAALALVASFAFGCVANADPQTDDELSAESNGKFTNSVLKDCADPGVMKHADAFYLVCTETFEVRTSRDLIHWSKAGPFFGKAPHWNQGGLFWAPEIHHFGSKFVALYTMLDKSGGKLAIGAALSDHPEGPFDDIGHPLVTDPVDGVIDANLFNAPDGKHYLYFKNDGNAHGRRTYIYGLELGDDLTHKTSRKPLLWNEPSTWEHQLVEAPWVIEHGGEFFMFYSGNGFGGPAYAVGVAKASHPLGDFQRDKFGPPILHSDKSGAFTGPGHNSIVFTGGRDWIVYHAHPGTSSERDLLLDPISWENGWPRVRYDAPSSTPIAKP